VTELHGTVHPSFRSVADAVAAQLRAGTETGLSLTVDLDGEPVVDLWGGHRDAARTQPWQRDAITNVWSITKCVTALAALLLVDAGDLDVTAPVARYWPEFAANGKRDVEVRHLLSHTSGLSGLEAPARLEDLYDVRGAADRLARQAPWWPPGTASGYHVLTYGPLVGELVHRITGRSLRRFVAEHLAGALQADFQIGLAATDLDRVADIVVPPGDVDVSTLDPAGVPYRTFSGPPFTAAAANTAAWRAAELGAANGHGNAASVTRLLAPIARGGLLRPRTVETIFDQQSAGHDLVNGLFLRWGIGFALSDPRTLPWIPAGRVAFWGGWGGSMAIVDLDRRATISYVMNRMDADILGSPRAAGYVTAIYQCLARLSAGAPAGSPSR